MHKHQQRSTRRNAGLANANFELNDDCRALIRSLLSGIRKVDFATEYLHEEYLSKFNGEGTTSAHERRSAAISKWKLVEERNRETNLRLSELDRGYNVLPRISFESFLRVARRIVAEVLGPLKDEVILGSFSGGASTGRKRNESHPALKFVGLADSTEGAMQYVDLLHRHVPLFRQYSTFYNLREVGGAVLFTVPKKTTIDRCACKEPEVNMYLQKGVGKHIRTRLQRFGINLNDQSINRELAQLGALCGDLATLDLSSASDTVTIETVRALLPSDWFLYLNDIRSPFVKVDDMVVKTEMFSSMGNGFTFELESLIFFSLMRATAYLRGHPGIISVYGDDLIIPASMYDDASWILGEFGFSLNPSKSFATGPFRESCGGHYHLHEDVTPFYLRRDPTHLTDLIRVCNQLRFWALSVDSRQYTSPELFSLWERLRNYVPSDLWGGSDYSVDTQLVSPHVPVNRLVRRSNMERLPAVGRYVQWHNSNWNRTSEAQVAFAPIRTDKFCRRRRAKPGTGLSRLWFREEL